MIYIASDHGGFKLKEELRNWLSQEYDVEDLGSFKLDPNDDYPNFIFPLAKKVVSDEKSFGIIIGRSGNGEAIVANKVKGIRAALCLNEEMAVKAKEHNNANVLALGADYIDFELAKKITQSFLDTPFSKEERHKRRIEKIKKIEEDCC